MKLSLLATALAIIGTTIGGPVINNARTHSIAVDAGSNAVPVVASRGAITDVDQHSELPLKTCRACGHVPGWPCHYYQAPQCICCGNEVGVPPYNTPNSVDASLVPIGEDAGEIGELVLKKPMADGIILICFTCCRGKVCHGCFCRNFRAAEAARVQDVTSYTGGASGKQGPGLDLICYTCLNSGPCYCTHHMPLPVEESDSIGAREAASTDEEMDNWKMDVGSSG
ncbi:hypothetical protein CC80DRAFT_572309 [Byssothecium circinans]|uniref:Uncharacterized protein n=1 Tax=Byssothecium circinans TaxID=147558 RepID=A0A6A5TLG7_9PLEO|nr:hypothetical protein CC80DRAFT_572309 [Byssothecium circinans]